MLRAGNGSGKTCAGCNEVLMEAFSENPYRSVVKKRRKLIWVAGDTMSNVEEIIMQKMYEWLPPENLKRWRYRTRPRPVLEILSPKGRIIARILLKSYEQGRKAFQGAEPDLILLDEEPPEEIWTEIYARTRAGGKIRITATPFGYGLIAQLLEDMEEDDAITDVQAHINDNVYLAQEERDRQIRKYGTEINRIDGSIWIPEGVIYKTPIDTLYIDRFDKMDYQSDSKYPDVWQLWEGIDLGGTDPFCCLFGLYNPATDVLVIVGEHYLRSSDIPMHRKLIGAIEVKIKEAYGISVCHARKFDNNNKVAVREFIVQGLHGSEVEKGSGSVEAGILLMRQRILAGKLKIVKGSAPNFEKEYKLYRYSSHGDGKPARHQLDHAVTCARYICQYLRPLKRKPEKKRSRTRRASSNYFLGRMK
jgi:phage terminase large subunit-like protein